MGAGRSFAVNTRTGSRVCLPFAGGEHVGVGAGRSFAVNTRTGSWMRRLVDLREAAGFERGVVLRGGEAGVSEQFLDGAQVAAGVEKVGGETVAESVGGGVLRQAEGDAGGGDAGLDDARGEAASAFASEQGGVGGEGEGAGAGVCGDGGAGGGEDGEGALFSAFSGDGEGVGEGEDVGVEVEGFGDAESAAVEEREDGLVARLLPIPACASGCFFCSACAAHSFLFTAQRRCGRVAACRRGS